MIRLVLIIIALSLALVSGIAVALHHYWGWKGLIAFPFLLIALLWGGKILVGNLIKKFFLSMFSLKSRVLREATMNVHSVKAIPMPKLELEDDDHDHSAAGDDHDHDEDADDEPRHYFQVDVTINPKDENRVWEPGEFILTSDRIKSLEELEDGSKELGTTHEVLIWNGTAFGPDEDGKYPGQQRLLITFAVKPNSSKAWLHYYDEPIGTLKLPGSHHLT
ncbi:MAG: hypothetical protein K0Q55_2099 [Verrucomicrobia bacterium]|nr:hypothetical protein [Verrucomicrobiota bacterium]